MKETNGTFWRSILEIPLLLKAQGKINEAIEFLEENLHIPGIELRLEAHLELADMYQQINDFNVSSMLLGWYVFESAKSEKTYLSEVLFRIAMNCKLQNEPQKAYKVLLQMIKQDPTFFQARMEFDRILLGQSMINLFQIIEKNTRNQTGVLSFLLHGQ